MVLFPLSTIIKHMSIKVRKNITKYEDVIKSVSHGG